MAKGLSDEVVNAMRFDPFEALGNDDGGDAGGQSDDRQANDEGGSQERKPSRQNAQDPAPKANRRERDASSDGEGDEAKPKPQVKGKTPKPAAPAGDDSSNPDEDDKPNSVAALMESLKNVPGFQPPAGGFQQPQAPQPPQQQQDQQQDRQGYDYSKPFQGRDIKLPPQLMDAIFNEDRNVAAQGLQVMVSTMYNSLQQEMHNRIAHVMQTLPPAIMQTSEVENGRKQLETKFYGKFPELNDVAGRATVLSIAQQVGNMYEKAGQRFDPLSDDFIDYVGSQAQQMLGRVRKKPAPRKQFQTGGGARSGMSDGSDPFMDAIGM